MSQDINDILWLTACSSRDTELTLSRFQQKDNQQSVPSFLLDSEGLTHTREQPIL